MRGYVNCRTCATKCDRANGNYGYTFCDKYTNQRPTIEPPVVQWISVKDRLPEVGKCVLLHHTYHAFIGEHGEFESVTIGYLYQPLDKRRKPYFYYAAVSDYGDMVRAESICPGSEFVTHWMPLPLPPKECNDANHN